MKVEVRELAIPDVKLLTPELFEDDRGFFVELFRRDVHEAAGLPTSYPQVNLSRSRQGVVRGLHFQWDPPMGKLMRVAYGRAFIVAVDIRPGSPTLGRWVGESSMTADPPRCGRPQALPVASPRSRSGRMSSTCAPGRTTAPRNRVSGSTTRGSVSPGPSANRS